MQVRRLLVTGFVLCMVSSVASQSAVARIEAVEGKVYTLTNQHGPWMIMVASFHSSGDESERDQGKSPEEAASELVLELRQRGIPAYVYAIEIGGDTVATRDRAGRPVQRTVRRSRSIAVLAGNYPGVDDDTAQQSLRWIKAYDPECLKAGVVFQPTEQRPTPLAAAFLTINPMLTPEEVSQQRVDPLLVRLNSDEQFSLLENQGAYTLVVARFSGKTVTQGFGSFGRPAVDGSDWDNDLDDAAEKARELTIALRRAENVESFVWHDRFETVVTVGEFSSPQDPRIAALRQRFGANTEVNPLLPRNYDGLSDVNILAVNSSGDKVDISNVGREGLAHSYQIWAFDPNPQVIRVPRAR